ncbi:MAG: hypothetical protein IKE30_05690 [Clostridia bacterium]|nr:hypothetical protein [Clostridia bacterium]
MSESKGRAKPRSAIHRVCAIVALACIAVMFVPVGQERGHGSQYGEILYPGEMQFAVSHATSGFTRDDPLYSVSVLVLAAAALFLLVWAVRSLQNRPGGTGLIAAVVNFLAAAFVLVFMCVDLGDYAMLIPSMVLIALLAVAAIALAAVQRKAVRAGKP